MKTKFNKIKSRISNENINQYQLVFTIKNYKLNNELEIITPKKHKIISIRKNNIENQGLLRVQNRDIIEIIIEKEEQRKRSLELELKYHLKNRIKCEEFKISSLNNKIKIVNLIRSKNILQASVIFWFICLLLLVFFSVKYDSGWIGLSASALLILLDFDIFSWFKQLLSNWQDAFSSLINPKRILKKGVSDFFSKLKGLLFIISVMLFILFLGWYFNPIKLPFNSIYQYYNDEGNIIQDDYLPYNEIDSILFSVKSKCNSADTSLIKLGYVKKEYFSISLNFFEFKYRPNCELSSIDYKIDIKNIIKYQSNYIDSSIQKRIYNLNSSIFFDQNSFTFCNKETYPRNIQALSNVAKVSEFIKLFLKSNSKDIDSLWELMHPNKDGEILFYYSNIDTLLGNITNRFENCFKRFSKEYRDIQSLKCEDIEKIYLQILYDVKNNQPKFAGGNLDLFYKQISIYLLFSSSEKIIDFTSYNYQKVFDDFLIFIKTYKGFNYDHRVLRMYSLLFSFIEEKHSHNSNQIENTVYISKALDCKVTDRINEQSKRKMFIWHLFNDYYWNDIYLSKERKEIFRPFIKGFLLLPNHDIITKYSIEETTNRKEYVEFVKNEIDSIFKKKNKSEVK